MRDLPTLAPPTRGLLTRARPMRGRPTLVRLTRGRPTRVLLMLANLMPVSPTPGPPMRVTTPASTRADQSWALSPYFATSRCT